MFFNTVYSKNKLFQVFFIFIVEEVMQTNTEATRKRRYESLGSEEHVEIVEGSNISQALTTFLSPAHEQRFGSWCVCTL